MAEPTTDNLGKGKLFVRKDGRWEELVVQKHGRWILKAGENWYGGGGYECSACKYGYAIGAYHEPDEFTYCPHCGAKMEKEEEE